MGPCGCSVSPERIAKPGFSEEIWYLRDQKNVRCLPKMVYLLYGFDRSRPGLAIAARIPIAIHIVGISKPERIAKPGFSGKYKENYYFTEQKFVYLIMKFDYWQDFYCGEIYHMYNKCVDGIKLFQDDQDYENFLNSFQRYFMPYTSILAYCLIPNHFHYLIKINEFDRSCIKKEDTNSARLFLENKVDENAFLQDQMRRFFSGVALKTNRKLNRKGSIFLNRCKRVIMNSKEDFEFKLCYIHHNPIHHGLCKSYTEWKYSSYNSFLDFDQTQGSANEVFKIIGDGNIEAGKENFKILHTEFFENFNHNEYGEW